MMMIIIVMMLEIVMIRIGVTDGSINKGSDGILMRVPSMMLMIVVIALMV